MGQKWEPTVGSGVGRHLGRATSGVYHCVSFTDRKWARSVPTFLQQMFDRENILTAGQGAEGKIYVLRYIALEVGENFIWIIFYIMRCGSVLSSTHPGMFSHCILFRFSHNSLSPYSRVMTGNVSIHQSFSKECGHTHLIQENSTWSSSVQPCYRVN